MDKVETGKGGIVMAFDVMMMMPVMTRRLVLWFGVAGKVEEGKECDGHDSGRGF